MFTQFASFINLTCLKQTWYFPIWVHCFSQCSASCCITHKAQSLESFALDLSRGQHPVLPCSLFFQEQFRASFLVDLLEGIRVDTKLSPSKFPCWRCARQQVLIGIQQVPGCKTWTLISIVYTSWDSDVALVFYILFNSKMDHSTSPMVLIHDWVGLLDQKLNIQKLFGHIKNQKQFFFQVRNDWLRPWAV